MGVEYKQKKEGKDRSKRKGWGTGKRKSKAPIREWVKGVF